MVNQVTKFHVGWIVQKMQQKGDRCVNWKGCDKKEMKKIDILIGKESNRTTRHMLKTQQEEPGCYFVEEINC